MSEQAVENLREYEAAKKAVYEKKSRRPKKDLRLDDFDDDLIMDNARSVQFADVVQVGSKVVIGGGVGLLAGVATIAVAASAAEVVVAGVVTKIAGVVGGAVGLSMGLGKFSKKKRSRA